MPKGTQREVMSPGQNQQPSRAGALALAMGTLPHGLGPRQTKALFLDLRACLEAPDAAAPETRRYGVVDNYPLHPATAVEPWLATHPRVTLLLVPTYGPRANPLERACGDGHDCCTRIHRRKRLPDLVTDVEDHLHLNGPWKYKRSDRYDEPAVTVAVAKSIAAAPAQVAA
jgi:hypothetical protein